jgi:DNA-binding GntR family transcriptional regulator
MLYSTVGAGRTQMRDEAAAYIRELIASGQARPHSLLRLKGLATTLDMSITPVREALLGLARDGWVIQEMNRGFRVAQLNRRDVADAYFIHAFAAGELAARAASNMTPAVVGRLRALDASIKEQCDADVPGPDERRRRIEDLNYALHGEIYGAAASPRLWWFLDAASHFGPRRFWVTIPGWFGLNRNGHTSVIDALEQQDVEASRERMKAHIEDAASTLLVHLDSLDFWASDDSETAVPRDSRSARLADLLGGTGPP